MRHDHRIHIVEAGGRGGVYQHALAVAAALGRAGESVVLHTATDPELEPVGRMAVCRCVDWHRDDPSRLRAARILLSWLGRTTPHLLRVVQRGQVFHFEGEFKAVLVTLGLLLQRLRGGRRVVLSRHNTFARSNRRIDELMMRRDARLAHSIIVFSQPDAARILAIGGRPVVSPLAQFAPEVDPRAGERWRARWGANGRPAVLFAGQIRPDKRLDLAIEASALMSHEHVLAVVGEDLGDLERCRRLAEERRVPVSFTAEYVPLDEFAAALAAADVVVCPYDRGSQSGILALARTLGARTVASDVGGFAELATAVAPPGDAAALAQAIDRVLAEHQERYDMDAGVVRAHLEAYGFKREVED
jgi:glycosyltransferase involved in cell wall biosynthesis